MTGILGLPPGLQGYVAAQQQNQHKQAQELGMLGQLLGLQGAVEDRQLRSQLAPMQIEQMRTQIDETKRKSAQDLALREARGMLFSPQNPAVGALGAGAAQGEVGPTVGNAGRLAEAPPSSAFSLNPAGIQRYIAAGGNPKDIEGITNLGPMGQLSKIDPKDYDSQTFAEYLRTNNPAVLRPRTKVELAPSGVAYDPFNTPVGKTFADPNKPFSAGPNGPTPNLPFQQYDLRRAATGAPKTNVQVSTDKTLFGGVAGKVADSIAAGADQARGAVGTLNTVGQIRQALDTGKVVAGPGTTARVFLGQLGQVMGVSGKDATETLTNTRSAIQGLAQLELDAAQQMKGQGQITEAERSIIRRAASGDIDGMTVPELRTLTNVLDKTARHKIRANEKNVQQLRSRPEASSLVPFMEVAEPPAYGGFRVLGKE